MFVSHAPAQNRVFDALYDPLFIVSGPKDAMRAEYVAMAQSTPIQILPKFNVMFSDLPKTERQIFFQPYSILPHNRYRADNYYDYCGIKVELEEFNVGDENVAKRKVDFVGRDRGCFFHYLSEAVTITACNVKFQKNTYDDGFPEMPELKIKTIGCQTVYRVSSAQTSPYQPDAIIGTDRDPEILLAAKILSGHSQAGEFEAKIIERARKRRQWEKSLPPVHSEKDKERRRVVLEAFEWEEWMVREEEIEEVQKLRLQLVYRLMQKREQCLKRKSKAKLENTARRINCEKQKKLEKLNLCYARALRKLEWKHNNLPRKYVKQNIVDEHVNYASELYAPQMRFGVNPNRRHFLGFKKKYSARLDQLDQKLREQPSLRCKISNIEDLAKPKMGQKEITAGFCGELNLKNMYETLKFLRSTSVQVKERPKCIKLIVRSQKTSIATPTTGIEVDHEAENNYQQAVYLQKIIKGRAIQEMLKRGKAKTHAGIREIRSSYVLPAVTELDPNATDEYLKKGTIVLKQQRHIQQIFKSKKEMKEILKETESEAIGNLLEFLEKELQRLYEQRKAHALYMLAERERRKREMAEATKRQRENRRRREHDEIHRNVTKSTRDTAAFYLENVLLEDCEYKADKDARSYVQALAKRIDEEATSAKLMHDYKLFSGPVENPCNEEKIIRDIVTDFVFPEVQKRLARRDMKLRQRRHLLAAHAALYEHIDTIYAPYEREAESVTLLENLVHRTVPTEEVLSIVASKEDEAHHEALKVVKEISTKILSGEAQEEEPKEQPPKIISSRSNPLLEIVSEISGELLLHALETAETVYDSDTEKAELAKHSKEPKNDDDGALETTNPKNEED